MRNKIGGPAAIAAIVLVLIVTGGIWWFTIGRAPTPADPQAVERMLQGEHGAPNEVTPAGAPTRQ